MTQIDGIRAARPGDGEEIVRLVGEGFSDELLGTMIYGCTGAARFVEEQLALPEGLSDTRYTVAADGKGSSGCVELRLLPDALFLNYICTGQGARSRGLGRRLLLHAIKGARTAAHREMLLDVFAHNDTARSWYERLGFRHLSRSQWWAFPPTGEVGSAGMVCGYPHAVAGFASYGFAQFRVVGSRGEYAVGLMGPGWFRVTQPEIMDDREACAALYRLDPARSVLALVPEGAIADAAARQGRLLVTSCRMSAGLEPLVAALS